MATELKSLETPVVRERVGDNVFIVLHGMFCEVHELPVCEKKFVNNDIFFLQLNNHI